MRRHLYLHLSLDIIAIEYKSEKNFKEVSIIPLLNIRSTLSMKDIHSHFKETHLPLLYFVEERINVQSIRFVKTFPAMRIGDQCWVSEFILRRHVVEVALIFD